MKGADDNLLDRSQGAGSESAALLTSLFSTNTCDSLTPPHYATSSHIFKNIKELPAQVKSWIVRPGIHSLSLSFVTFSFLPTLTVFLSFRHRYLFFFALLCSFHLFCSSLSFLFFLTAYLNFLPLSSSPILSPFSFFSMFAFLFSYPIFSFLSLFIFLN